MTANSIHGRNRSKRCIPASFYVSNVLMSAILLVAATIEASARGPESVADVAETLQDAVVNISTTQSVKKSQEIPVPRVPKGSPFEEFFNDFFNQRRGQDAPRQVSSLGSGFVIDPSGLIVTNNHVIEGADEITANFSDGTKLKVVKVIGRDTKTDLALLKVEPKKPLTSVTFGNSASMRVGDWVMAIGNPFGLGGTLTVGVISAKKRDINSGPYDEFIQTDAAINRGNSGGPLFNMDGKVIGVNTAIISPTGGSIGIGFAVPANTVKQVISQLQKFGETRRGWLGVRIQTVSAEIAESIGLSEPTGALVADVTEKSPAADAGIVAGDVILKFDGQDVPNMRVLPRIVARTDIEKNVDVEIFRKGKKQTVKVRIGKLQEEAEPKETVEELAEKSNESLLGLSIAPLSDALRSQYKIGSKIKGVVITEVEPDSEAAQKNIKPGDVIVEVTQEEVKTPDEVSKRVAEVSKSGRKSVLLLISNAKGDLRFIALPVDG